MKKISLTLLSTLSILLSGCVSETAGLSIGLAKKLSGDPCVAMNGKYYSDNFTRDYNHLDSPIDEKAKISQSNYTDKVIEKTTLKTDSQFHRWAVNRLISIGSDMSNSNRSICSKMNALNLSNEPEAFFLSASEWSKLLDDNLVSLETEYLQESKRKMDRDKAINECLAQNKLKPASEYQEPLAGNFPNGEFYLVDYLYKSSSSDRINGAKYILDTYYPQFWPLYAVDYRNRTNFEALVRFHWFYTKARNYTKEITRTFSVTSQISTFKNIFVLMPHYEALSLFEKALYKTAKEKREEFASAQSSKVTKRKDANQMRKSLSEFWDSFAIEKKGLCGVWKDSKYVNYCRAKMCEIKGSISLENSYTQYLVD